MSAVDFTPEQIALRFAAITGRHDGPVTCQCDQHTRPCRQHAVAIVELHLLDNCNGPEANEWGNRVELLCLACTQHLWREAEQRTAELRHAAAQVGMVAHCTTCQAPASRPSDLVRSLEMRAGGVQ